MASLVNDTSYYVAVETSRIILLGSIPLITIMTVVANGLYIITLVKKRTLHTPSNMLLGALAISDVLVGIVANPIWMIRIFSNLNTKTVAEKLSGILMFFFILLSLLNMVMVSSDRYIAIFYPFSYHANATCKTHIKVGITVLAISILIFVPMGILSLTHLITASFMYLSLVCTSLTITSYCNIKIFHLIRKKGRQVNTVPANESKYEESEQTAARVTQHKNNAIVIAIITALFVVCYMPFIICSTIIQLGILVNRNLALLLNLWTVFLVLLNSVMNPVVYCVRMRSVRKAFKEVFCKNRIQLEGS